MAVFPQLVMSKKIIGEKEVTVASGAVADITIELGGRYAIVGVPYVYSDNADLKVKVVNGGINKFTVEVQNTGTADVTDKIKYEVLVAVGS